MNYTLLFLKVLFKLNLGFRIEYKWDCFGIEIKTKNVRYIFYLVVSDFFLGNVTALILTLYIEFSYTYL